MTNTESLRTSPLWGGRNAVAQRKRFGWGQRLGTLSPPPEKASLFRPPHKGEVRSRADSGYTLMELLVVLAILGLLAAIATPMVLKYLDSAKLGTAKTEIANLSAGLDLFKYDVGRYPSTQEGLDALVKAPADVDNWNGPYVKTTTNLKDPWGHPFGYRAPGEHGEFDLYSDGPTGKEDTGEKPAIANW
jgi:general secretion pathway protein G